MSDYPDWISATAREALLEAERAGNTFFVDLVQGAVVGVRCRIEHEDNLFLSAREGMSYAGRFPLGEGLRGREVYGMRTSPTKRVSGSFIEVVHAVLRWDAEEEGDVT